MLTQEQTGDSELPRWVVLFAVGFCAYVIRTLRTPEKKPGMPLVISSAVVGGFVGMFAAHVLKVVAAARGYEIDLVFKVFTAFAFGYAGITVFESITNSIESITTYLPARFTLFIKRRIDTELPTESDKGPR